MSKSGIEICKTFENERDGHGNFDFDFYFIFTLEI